MFSVEFNTGTRSGGEEPTEVAGVSLNCEPNELEYTIGFASLRVLRVRPLRLCLTGMKLLEGVAIKRVVSDSDDTIRDCGEEPRK